MIAKYFAYFWLSFLVCVGVVSTTVFSIVMFYYPLIILLTFSLGLSILKKKFGIVLLFIALGSASGWLIADRSLVSNEYNNLIGQRIDLEAIVATDPTQTNNSQQLVVKPDGFAQFLQVGMFFPVDTKMGDRVWLRGEVAETENFSDFDYISYLQKNNIYAKLKKPQVVVLERSSISARSLLIDLRGVIINRTEKVFRGDSASLVLGMLIGYKKTISESLQEAFRRTGLSHVVAVSGYNMTIIVISCGVFAWWIGRRNTNMFTVGLVVGFTIITGGSASVVRAAIMALLAVFAQTSGRLYTSYFGLVWAAGLMVLHNPLILIWDVGFQLSVVATFGIITSSKISLKEDEFSFFRSIILPTLSAIIFTAPLVAFHFKSFSVVALIVNIILLPLVPWIMFCGALSLIPGIGIGFAVLTNILTTTLVFVTTKFSALSFSSVSFSLSLSNLILIYTLLLLISFWAGNSNKKSVI